MAAKKRKTQRYQRKQPHLPIPARRPISEPPPVVHLVLSEYEITDGPLEDRTIKQLPAHVDEQIGDLYDQIHHTPKEAIPALEHLLAMYPHVPLFYNHLSVACMNAGETAKAEALIQENYTRHSQYLFAKVNYANLCLQRGEIAKIPDIFDHKFDLKQLYPHRKRFHISEFTGFAGVMCRYFCATGDQATAALYYRVLKQLAPRHPMTKQAKRALYPPFWIRWLRKWAERLAEKPDKTQSHAETRRAEGDR
jgi:hypothetical protein